MINKNKTLMGKMYFATAFAAGCMAAASGFGHAATGGGNTGPSKFDSPSIQRQASASTSEIKSSNSTKTAWRGATPAEWTQRWWRWWMSIPFGVGPTNDETGAQCGINQNGPVWFIGGPLGNTFERSCNIPRGKAIISPIVDFINDYPCPAPQAFEPAPGQSLEDFLVSGVTPYIDGATVHTAELDGKPLHVRRITTGLFSFTAAADLVPLDPCVTGSPQLGVSDGYFIFIEPPSAGEHILHIHSELPSLGFSNDGTYYLKIGD